MTHVAFMCSVLLQSMTGPQSFFVFHELDTFKEYWTVMLYNVPDLGFVYVASSLNTGLCFWHEHHRNGILSLIVHHIRRYMMSDCLITDDVDYSPA